MPLMPHYNFANTVKQRIAILFSMIFLLASSSLVFAFDSSVTDNFIKASAYSNRSNYVALNGSTVSGSIYIFVVNNNYKSVSYYLDTNGNTDNKLMTTGKRTAPFDFAYTNSDKTAKPFDTKKLKDGKHELIVVVRDINNKYTKHYAIFYVKNIVVTTTTTVATTTTPVTTTATTVPPVFSPRFAGDVSPGFVRWGSAIGGNSDPITRYSDAGKLLGLRRTYYGWSNLGLNGKMVTVVKEDISNYRLPWVSIKPPAAPAGYNSAWKAVGDGLFDKELQQMFLDLGTVPGPVWFTLHHEPEGGCKPNCASNGTDDEGGPGEWLRMQERAGLILRNLRAQGKATNVAFAPILMAWTFQSASGRDPNQWYKQGIWDFAGIDVYVEKVDIADFSSTNNISGIRKFYGDRGLKWAIGEWGNRTCTPGTSCTADQELQVSKEMRDFYNFALNSGKDQKGSQLIGLAYFDSNLNSETGGWELQNSALSTFKDLISAPTSLRSNKN